MAYCKRYAAYLLHSSHIVMADFLIDFEWFRCPEGYRLVHASETARARGEPPGSYPDCDWIVPNSDERIPYRPLDRYDMLCNVFAGIKTPNDLLKFVELYGPLTTTSTQWGDSVPELLRHVQYFRGLLHYKQLGSRKLGSFFVSMKRAGLLSAGVTVSRDADLREFSQLIGTIDLVADKAKGVRLRISTDFLIAALWWQLGQKLSGNSIVRECRHCGTLFEAGPGTNRRGDATFCCNEHSVRFHSLKRSTGG
jgi:hypothetical protein